MNGSTLSNKRVLVIGISGVTCGGKTTLASKLNQVFPQSKVFSQDDYFLDVEDSRHTWIPKLNHINFDILSALDMEKMYCDISSFLAQYKLFAPSKKSLRFPTIQDDVSLETIVCDKIKKLQLDIVIVEGFCIFNYEPLLPLLNLKYYFTLPRDECFRRRLERIYEPPDCPGYFEDCVWPEHVKQLEEVEKKVTNVRYFDDHTKDSLVEVLKDLANIL